MIMNSEMQELHLKVGKICGQEKTCGKKMNYKNEETATKSAAVMNRKYNNPDHVLEPYPCAFCGGWHIGRMMPKEWMVDFLAKVESGQGEQ
jgi:hypothetical protein